MEEGLEKEGEEERDEKEDAEEEEEEEKVDNLKIIWLMRCNVSPYLDSKWLLPRQT